jgi:hypothetical protein
LKWIGESKSSVRVYCNVCVLTHYAHLFAAGFFYWMNEVQEYDKGGWNYINELRSFVDGGMVDEGFINAVSGIVNRGCHNPVRSHICFPDHFSRLNTCNADDLCPLSQFQPCGTGDLDGGPERAENFMKVVDEMRFAFVEVTGKEATRRIFEAQFSSSHYHV